MLITDDGTIIRTPLGSVSIQGRTTQGVRLMRVDDGAQVVGVAVGGTGRGGRGTEFRRNG